MKKFSGFDYVLVDSRLSEDEKMVRDTIRSFIEEEALPKFMEHYEKGTFPTELVKPLAELGVFGATIHGYECAGLNNVAYGLMMQELERGDSGLRSFASVQSGLVMYPIYAFGDDEQKNKWLPALAKGKVIGCFGLTEADFGSNPGGMITTARLDGNEYVLNGSKMWITNGVASGVAIVWAKLDGEINGFLVERERKGFDAKPIHHKLSMRASDTAELVIDGVRIPKSNRLPGAKGLKGALMCLTQARYGIAWGAVGSAMACFDEAASYAKNRVMFGKPIGGFQLQQARLAEMLTEITKAQLLCLQLGRLKDQGKATPQQVSLAKRNNVSIATDVAREARRLLGANGILAEYQAMRHLANLESVYTYEGTHDVHTLILGQEITGLNAFN